MNSNPKPIVIKINDIFDELKAENKRLLNELLFANQLKSHLIKIYEKYESVIDCEDKQHFQRLLQDFHQINGQRDGQKCLDKTSEDQNNGRSNESMDEWTQELSESSDESVVNETHDKSSRRSERNTRLGSNDECNERVNKKSKNNNQYKTRC